MYGAPLGRGSSAAHGGGARWQRGDVAGAARCRRSSRCASAIAVANSFSKDQVMTYPYYARILKPSPPTIYHGQGLAWGSHTGPY